MLMDLAALKIFLAVAEERSFSRAAAKVHRTQPAVSQAVRRLEDDLGEQLFDRSSKSGTLTDAGRDAAELRAAAGPARRGDRVGDARAARPAARPRADRRQRSGGPHAAAADGAVPRSGCPTSPIDVRRVPARQIAVEVQQGSLDFGALTFRPAEDRPARSGRSAATSSCCWCRRRIALARRRQVSMEDVADGAGRRAQRSVAGARARAAAVRAAPHRRCNMVIALPSLDGIKRAVEMKLGVALLPRRCAITEIASGRLVAMPVAGISRRRQVMLVCRSAHRSHAANAFLAVAQKTVEAGHRHRRNRHPVAPMTSRELSARLS